MNLKPIEQAHEEAEAFFKRDDVEAIFQEAFALATVKLPNYQIGKTNWGHMYTDLHPSKQKRDALKLLQKDLFYVASALNRRIKSIEIKDYDINREGLEVTP